MYDTCNMDTGMVMLVDSCYSPITFVIVAGECSTQIRAIGSLEVHPATPAICQTRQSTIVGGMSMEVTATKVPSSIPPAIITLSTYSSKQILAWTHVREGFTILFIRITSPVTFPNGA